MDEIKAYIESGILELYVMGELTPDEKREVEVMAEKHASVRSELAEIENALEGYARSHAIEPNSEIRNKIIGSLQFDAEDNQPGQPDAVIVPIRGNAISPFYKYAFAASIAILLLSWGALFVLYNRLQDSRSLIASLQSSNEKFANRVNYFNKELEVNKTEIAVLRSPDFKFVKLAGTKKAPNASVLVAFNPKKKEVMIDMTSMKMPSNDQEHQYQLWALVNGKPVDLGVFDMSADKSGMVKMKELGTAQAFAVTLEPRGGSVNPTMDQMMVMGAISI